MNQLANNDHLSGRDRLIVALDVPSHDEAVRLVQNLGNVSFFKIGLQLFLTGQVLDLIRTLREERDGKVFLDIKWGGDIVNTTSEFMQACIDSLIVKFITLIEARDSTITQQTIDAGLAAREAANVKYPHFLMVPYLSSLDSSDLNQTLGTKDVDRYILERGEAMLGLGCDGLIVSGDAIKLCRDKFGPGIDIVSPGVRPTWASRDDHKRFTTPSQAISMGADYLVVGRPIIKASDPRSAAQRVIDEIDQELEKPARNRSTSSGGGTPQSYTLAAKGQH